MQGAAMSLEGRTAVVTGGGRGIGAAVAHALAEQGTAVVVAGRSQAAVEGAAEKLRSAGRSAWALRCDVTHPDSVAEMARAAIERLGRVDILINNAGIAHAAPLAKLTLDDWERLFAVNATGTFLCTQAFLQPMLERKWGRVVNIASVAGLKGAKYIAGYAASKHAVVGFTRCVAAETAGKGVTVNAVCPGYVDTDMTRESLQRVLEKTSMSREQALEAMLATSGQKRLVQPPEVARTVVWLCENETINGHAVLVEEQAEGRVE
jgi:NAD(P)-dependent dehydrogenase (short-subunit alcohol dehydrogenase family)